MNNDAKYIKSPERVKKLGEVFTPELVVKKMCDDLEEHNKDAFDIDKTFLEPSCGTGNFLVEVYERKLKRCHSKSEAIRALESIYGVDIMLDNVHEARRRLIVMYCEAYGYELRWSRVVANIVKKNIICADFLKICDKIKTAESWSEVVEI